MVWIGKYVDENVMDENVMDDISQLEEENVKKIILNVLNELYCSKDKK
jgi:hypothetical protein